VIAVVLAAGTSSRLRPLTNHIPKSLLPVGKIPLLQRTLESLYRSHIRECVIVTGFQKAKVEAFVHSLRLPLSTTFVENPRYASTGNNYSLWTAYRNVQGRNMLLMDADILFDSRILQLLMNAPIANGLIMRTTNHLGSEEIKVQVDKSGIVKRIGKDFDPLVAAGESIGIEKFDAKTVDLLFEILARRKDRTEFYEASFQELIDHGSRVHAVDSQGLPCMEIDTIEDLTAANALAESLS